MKTTSLTVSLIALSLLTLPVSAQETGPAAAPVRLAQASAEIPADVEALLRDKRPAADLSDAELNDRLHRARGFIKSGNLPQDVRKSLRILVVQSRTELISRSQSGAKQQAGSGGGTQESTATGSDQQADTATAAQPNSRTSDDATALLRDTRPASALSDSELQQRFRKARALLKSGILSPDMHRSVQKIARQARLELASRSQGGKRQQTGGTTSGEQSQSGGEQTAQNGAQQTQSGGTNAGNNQSQQSGGNQGDPGDEAKARALLNNSAKAENLSDRELNQRLRDMRDLLAGNRLSRDTARALRSKLQAERAVLRTRIAANNRGNGGGGNNQSGGSGNNQSGGGNNTKPGNTNINITVILADNRDAGLLDDEALRIRIDVFRDAVLNARYAEQERQRWRRIMERDRLILRERLIAQRRLRAERLRHDNININIGINFQPDRPPPRDVFAAEVGDAEIEDVLIAPPRRKIERRYTVEEVEASPELRDALPRIEIDTIHFGFGESFVREEEVENLDRIAEIMEKILTAHPREVFMIEGHTDAVGSDSFNLDLSRQRAVAIKQALTTYYVIPPQNLRTVGYGERFLKIPTSEAEAENRRVSIARATQLLGEAEQ